MGRRHELLELPKVLASSRLLSLTGAGGVGKTRLAIRLAASLMNVFRDGVWLVDLAALTSPDLMTPTIATALGVREGPQRSVRDALRDSKQPCSVEFSVRAARGSTKEWFGLRWRSR